MSGNDVYCAENGRRLGGMSAGKRAEEEALSISEKSISGVFPVAAMVVAQEADH